MAKTILQNRLASLDAKYKRKAVNKRFRVFYGWCRVNKIRKKEAISVVFENDSQREERTMKFIRRMMDVVYVRDQTDNEQIVMSPQCRLELDYIQERFHIKGGESPADEIIPPLKKYIAQLEEATELPKWAETLFKERYGIKLYL